MVEGIGTISRLVGIGAFGLGILSILKDGYVRRLTRFHGYLYFFMLWSAVSFIWSVNVQATEVRVQTNIQLLIMVFLIYQLSDSRERIHALFLSYILGSFVSIYATFQDYRTMSAIFESQGWGSERYGVDYYAKGQLALIVVIGIPLTWYLITNHRWKKVLSLPLLLYLPFATIAVLLTASRSGFIVFVLSILTVVVMTSEQRNSRRVALLIISVAIFILLLRTVVLDPSLERIATIPNELLGGGTLSERTIIWRYGMDIIRSHLLLGVGAGAFVFAMPVSLSAAFHNTFLEVLAEVGIIGFIPFLAILVTSFTSLRRMRPPERRLWLSLLLIWTASSLAISLEVLKVTWLLFILAKTHAQTLIDEQEMEAAQEFSQAV